MVRLHEANCLHVCMCVWDPHAPSWPMYCVYMQVVADILSNVLDESNTPAFTATETVSALYLYHCSVCTLDLILIDSNNI